MKEFLNCYYRTLISLPGRPDLSTSNNYGLSQVVIELLLTPLTVHSLSLCDTAYQSSQFTDQELNI